MKNYLFSVLFILSTTLKISASAVITGTIINSKSKFVSLEYNGGYDGGSPNYYGQKLQSAFFNEKNEFKFSVETSVDYSTYNLYFKANKKWFTLILRDRDSINITVDLKNINNSFFVTGKGSGLTNLWFVVDIYKPKYRPEIKDNDLIRYWKNKNKLYLDIIQSFNLGKVQKNDSISKEMSLNINRIIQQTKLTDNEIELTKANARLYCIFASASSSSFEYLWTNIDQFLQQFQNFDLSKNVIVNDGITSAFVNYFITLSCFKELKTLKEDCSIEEAVQYKSDHYDKMAKQVLKGDLFDKTIVDGLYVILLQGDYENYEKKYEANKPFLKNKTYLAKLDEFYNNYLTLLSQKDFNLGTTDKELNDSTVYFLLNSLTGQMTYLILWKISPETSYTLTPIWNLSIINIIRSRNKNIRFIDICLGDENNKQHWASMIINHQWQGEHYFYSQGNKVEFKKTFNITNKLDDCVGEYYYLLNENKEIIKDNGSVVIEF